MEKLIETILCRDDSGNEYKVEVRQKFTLSRHMQGEDWIPGLKRASLPTGENVNYIDEFTFKIVPTGIILHRL
ncbi:hypothetical protein PE067_08170 [Paracoccus sp. DMF-8]|uniref:hypothetical protein n=1 Tax=Paracoccus sp. DMF-8 TaxID=3019445 RepID=UPI0023E8BB13|nr:hypothetical protein [Paracoccus sp. DMF-8]MDF3606103.1 hypothetical protein [Paracoccus sp. DMF-8]